LYNKSNETIIVPFTPGWIVANTGERDVQSLIIIDPFWAEIKKERWLSGSLTSFSLEMRKTPPVSSDTLFIQPFENLSPKLIKFIKYVCEEKDLVTESELEYAIWMIQGESRETILAWENEYFRELINSFPVPESVKDPTAFKEYIAYITIEEVKKDADPYEILSLEYFQKGLGSSYDNIESILINMSEEETAITDDAYNDLSDEVTFLMDVFYICDDTEDLLEEAGIEIRE
jgi:hypothetical protein